MSAAHPRGVALTLMRRLVVGTLGLIAAGFAFLACLSEPASAPPPPRPRAQVARQAPAESAPPDARAGRPATSLGSPKLDAQVTRVIESMDRTGRPPTGVGQGGRRGGPKGVFDNAKGALPRRPPGHYRESDVWPRRREGRGAERLVFSRDGDVYYTRDHYRSFVKVR